MSWAARHSGSARCGAGAGCSAIKNNFYLHGIWTVIASRREFDIFLQTQELLRRVPHSSERPVFFEFTTHFRVRSLSRVQGEVVGLGFDSFPRFIHFQS